VGPGRCSDHCRCCCVPEARALMKGATCGKAGAAQGNYRGVRQVVGTIFRAQAGGDSFPSAPLRSEDQATLPGSWRLSGKQQPQSLINRRHSGRWKNPAHDTPGSGFPFPSSLRMLMRCFSIL